MTILKRRSFLATGLAFVFAPFGGLKAAEPKPCEPCEHDWTAGSGKVPLIHVRFLMHELRFHFYFASKPDSRKCRKCAMPFADLVKQYNAPNKRSESFRQPFLTLSRR